MKKKNISLCKIAILVLLLLIIIIIFLIKIINTAINTIKKDKISLEKFSKYYYPLLNCWIDIIVSGRSIEKYFLNHNISTIAIYGIGELGFHLYNVLENSNIKVLYAIDKGISSRNVKIEIKSLSENLPEVDALVVTPVFAYKKIEQELHNKIKCKIISLEDIIYGV